ncbi:hypothetical protein FQN57_005277 [Myotisia sp. PD_48]|nr:hypothetical protein FQN57_005277 [Myotisia sp. PD_48]
MAASPTQRNPLEEELTVADDPKHAAPRHIYEREPADYGLFIQIVRSVFIVSWFLCCCTAILATQAIGLPLLFYSPASFKAWISMTKRAFGITITALTEWCSPTPVRISGDPSVLGQFRLKANGRLQSLFPERLVLIANHQVYTDWLYLWWVAYTNQMHGYIFIILKESLKYIPVIGQGMMLYGFIFMSRKWSADKPRLQHSLEKLNRKRDNPTPGMPFFDPMWLLIFPEGTNLSKNTKRISDAYGNKQNIRNFQHQLIPRTTGLFFCLQQLRGTVDWVYDCTMGYEGPGKGNYPDAYFTIRSTYLRGCPPRVVNFYWRRFAISDIPLEDQQAFEAWLFKRWEEKDALLTRFTETGRFPPFEETEKTGDNLSHQPTKGNNPGYLESEVRLGYWFEVTKVFSTLFLACMAIKWLQSLWN